MMFSHYLRTMVAGLAMAVAMVGVAQEVVVETNDGRTLRGELIGQSSESVRVDIAGITATIDRDDIADMTMRASAQSEYRKRRAALGDDDVQGRLTLARDMYERDALAQATAELEALEGDFPDNPQVAELRRMVEARAQLEAQSNSPGSAGGEPRDERDRRWASQRPAADEDRANPYLSQDQINLIKVYEVVLATEPIVEISAETLEKFFERYEGQRGVPTDEMGRRAFRVLPGHEQLRAFFDVQARDLYSEVVIRQDPEPIAVFQRLVNPRYVSRYFQPTFGEGRIEGLRLINRRPTAIEEAYTNFFLLSQFEYEGQPMINRANPAHSLLLQWGLPREVARHPAPEVERWRPAFRSPEDPTFLEYAQWIDSLYEYDPDYGIDFSLVPQADAPSEGAPSEDGQAQ